MLGLLSQPIGFAQKLLKWKIIISHFGFWWRVSHFWYTALENDPYLTTVTVQSLNFTEIELAKKNIQSKPTYHPTTTSKSYEDVWNWHEGMPAGIHHHHAIWKILLTVSQNTLHIHIFFSRHPHGPEEHELIQICIIFFMLVRNMSTLIKPIRKTCPSQLCFFLKKTKNHVSPTHLPQVTSTNRINT